MIKKGLTNSIGWNLGNKYKSIHLFEPLTSIPIIGTRNKKINENKKIIIENFKSFSWLTEERKKIIIIPKKIKNKCLKKNEYSLVSNLSETIKEVDTNEKNSPVTNNKIIKENMNLSIFFHHS